MAALTLTGISGNPLANVSLTGTLAGTSIGATLAGSQGFTVGVLTPTPPNNATVTIAAGNVLTGGGSFTTDQASNSTITINHEDVSSATSISGLTGAAVVSEVTVDEYGHTTGLAQRNLTLANLGYTGATDADNYTSWSINADSAGADAVTSGQTLNINTSSPLSSSYVAGTNTLTLSSTAITDVVNDLTPELGGDLTLGSNDIIGTGNINITGTTQPKFGNLKFQSLRIGNQSITSRRGASRDSKEICATSGAVYSCFRKAHIQISRSIVNNINPSRNKREFDLHSRSCIKASSRERSSADLISTNMIDAYSCFP